jgi:hypothetical protein
MGDPENYLVKGTQALNFFLLLAETLWSQGPVIRDF